MPKLIVGKQALIALGIVAALLLTYNRAIDSTPVKYLKFKPYNVILGQPGNHLNKPEAVAVGPNGQLYIADTGNKRIVVIEENGRYTLEFGGKGSGLAELGNPVSIDIAPNGNVFVADKEKHTVIAFDGRGEYLYTISEKGGKFSPISVQVDKQGRVFVFDEGSNKFKIYDMQGKKLTDFPDKPLKDIKNITSLDADPTDDQIFAVSHGKKGYYQFSDGEIKNPGVSNLIGPRGIVYNRSKRLVIVSDSYKNKMVIFDKKGNFLAEFGGSGEGMTGFNFPAGLAFDERGKLFIADRNNNRIVIYTN